MKRLFQYTAWNWSMNRGPSGLLMAIGCMAECVLLFIAASLPYLAGADYHELVMNSGVFWVAVLEYLLLPLCAQMHQLLPAKKSRASDTILTLPMPRWQLPAGRMLATAFWLLLGMAVQVMILFLMWGPVTALQESMVAGRFRFEVTVQGRAWWAMAGCGLLRLLLPTEGAGLLFLVLLVLVPAMLVPAVAACRGRKRVVAIVLALSEQFGLVYFAIPVVAENLTAAQLADTFLRSSGFRAGGTMMTFLAAGLLLCGIRAWYRCEPAA